MKQQNKLKSLQSTWRINSTDYYAGHYKCTKCGQVRFCTARYSTKLKCKECHYGILYYVL